MFHERQNEAISDEIELRLKRNFGVYPNSVEGRRQAEWILMDYVDFIVHIFSPEKRAFYGLERLRKSATSLSVEELNDELKAKVTATRTATPKVKKKTAAKVAKKTAAKKSARKSAGKASAKTSAKKVTAKKAPAKKIATKRTGAKSRKH